MALVKLKYDWFAPNAQHFGKGVVDVPEHLLKALPSSAKLVEKRPEPVVEKVASLKDHDGERAAADAEAAATDEAERERLENRRRLEAKLAAEANGKKK